MIIQQNGRYYIALYESTQLDDIIQYQNGLVDLLKMASQSPIFDGADDTVFHICRLLQELSITPEQATEMEFWPVGKVFREEDDGGEDDKALPLG